MNRAKNISKKIIAISLLSLLMINNANPFSAMRMFMKVAISSWTGVKQFGVPYTSGSAVTANSSGNVFVAGQTTDTPEGIPMTWYLDSIITKYDSNGLKKWTRQLGAGSENYNNGSKRYTESKPGGAVADQSGNVFVTGYVEDPDTTTTYFLTKYNSEGTKLWSKQIGATGGSSFVGAGGIAIDNSGSVFVGGALFWKS